MFAHFISFLSCKVIHIFLVIWQFSLEFHDIKELRAFFALRFFKRSEEKRVISGSEIDKGGKFRFEDKIGIVEDLNKNILFLRIKVNWFLFSFANAIPPLFHLIY